MLTGDATAVAVDRIAVESRSVMEAAAVSTALSPASSSGRSEARSTSAALAAAPDTTQATAQSAAQPMRPVSLAAEPAPHHEDQAPAMASYTDKDKDKKNEKIYVALARQLAVENAHQCPSLGYPVHWIYNKSS